MTIFYCTLSDEHNTTCWLQFNNSYQRAQHQIFEHQDHVQGIRTAKYRKYLKTLVKDPNAEDPF
jgi:hypothetical protein